MGGHDRDGDGNYIWKCFYCDYVVVKRSPQGRGLARSNHLRKHGIWTWKGKIRK